MEIIDRNTMNTGIQGHKVISCDNQQNKDWVEAMARFYNCRIVERHRKNQFGYNAGYGNYVISLYCDIDTWYKMMELMRKKTAFGNGEHIVFKGVKLVKSR